MMAGFAAAGRLVRAGRTRTTLLAALALAALGAVLFATAPGLPALFVARGLMGLGSGGLWIGVTFATLAYWPGQEYLCMSRIYAAYSAGALLGPLLGAVGGTSAPFLIYALLLVLVAPATAMLPTPTDRFHSDRGALGGFNWSLQHLEGGGVDGQASGVDEGVDGPVGDEVAGCAVAAAGC